MDFSENECDVEDIEDIEEIDGSLNIDEDEQTSYLNDNHYDMEVDESANPVRRGRPKSVEKGTTSKKNPRKNKTVMLSAMKYASYLCCVALCLSAVQEETVLALQEVFNMLTKSEKSQWILDWLWTHHSYKDGHLTCTFLIGTTSVCLSAWLAILGVPVSTFYSIRKLFQSGIRVMPKQGRTKGRLSIEALNCITWLQQYAARYAEKHPDSTNLDLPPCLTRHAVFEIMEEELHNEGLKTVSETYFISSLWKKYCSNVKIPPTSRFSKCDTCVLLKLKIAETKSKEQRAKIFEQRRKHLEKQSKERQKYYKHAMKSRRDPNKYLSIIIDGMDQQKTCLPNFVLLSKFTSGMWRLRTHLVGTIVHGIGIYGFFDFFQWPHSTNLTLTILVKIFNMLKEDLPDTLYLQMDNCARENKNRYVFAFFTWLVEIGVFKKVKINFLMVGHTHEDVDQVFSRFSSWLAKYAVLTFPQLMQAFENCYTPNPISIEMETVFNITEWLGPHIEKLQGHSKPHCFKIKKDGGKTKLLYKNWSTDKQWHDATLTTTLLKSMPSGEPAIVEPCLDDTDLKRVEESVNSAILKEFIRNQQDIEWWKTFFQTIGDAKDLCDWPINDILRKKQPETMGDEELVEEQDISNDYVNVIVGKACPKKSKNLQEGDMVCTDIAKYAGEWPQIAKVLSIGPENTVQVHWYKGSKSSSWTPCTMPVQGVKGKRQNWEEEIDISNIWHYGYKLTPSGHLPKKVKDLIDNYDH